MQKCKENRHIFLIICTLTFCIPICNLRGFCKERSGHNAHNTLKYNRLTHFHFLLSFYAKNGRKIIFGNEIAHFSKENWRRMCIWDSEPKAGKTNNILPQKGHDTPLHGKENAFCARNFCFFCTVSISIVHGTHWSLYPPKKTQGAMCACVQWARKSLSGDVFVRAPEKRVGKFAF